MHNQSALLTALLLCAPVSLLTGNAAAAEQGPLDRPSFVTNIDNTGVQADDVVQVQSLGTGNTAQIAHARLRQEVAEEQDELAKLDRDELESKAELGERAAQVALAANFATEASKLSFAPAAANDAMSDAARWYSMAASHGSPGAPSLDQAGVRFSPIRVQRSPQP